MTLEPGQPRLIGPTLTETAFEWFQRIVALYCLLFGVLYWVRLVGYFPGPLWRFDLMPLHWQIVAPTLAVLFPFAAIGLWMLSSWGPVIWFICAALECVMYQGMPERFGHRDTIVAAHVLVALIYVGFRVALYVQRRSKTLTAH